MLSSTVTETSLSQVFRQFWLRFYCTSLWTEEREYNTALNNGSSNSTNHKNYNFLACDWFKTVLFSTNSLAKLLSDSWLLDSTQSYKHYSLIINYPFSISTQA